MLCKHQPPMHIVIPAQAGIQFSPMRMTWHHCTSLIFGWIPACAGMTGGNLV